MFRRFWFVIYPEDRYGLRNFGVTASTKREATGILNSYLKNDREACKLLTGNTEIIEDIDISLLEQNHIIPNMGVVVFKGIWWPRDNL